MFKKLAEIFEDPMYPLLSPSLKSLHFWGIILPKTSVKKFSAMLMHISLLVFAFIVCIDMWFLRTDFDLLLRSVKFNLLTLINCVKIVSFLIWQKKWIDILKYVTRADISSRNRQDTADAKIIDSYTKYCRKVTYLYWFLTLCTVITVILQPIAKYVFSPTYRENVRNHTELFDQVLSHKAPFDNEHIPEYILALVYTSWCTIYAGGLINSFDTTAIVIMVFFKGELLLLRRSCSKIFDTENDDGVLANLKDCHHRHVELVKYAALFNSCLSPIMFLYMVVTSFTLCATVYQITIETGSLQRLLTAEYAVFGVAQLLFYCWHGNDVLYTSHAPMQGVYESAWWKRVVHRKEIILLTGQLDKRVLFTAGPFITLTLTSFVNVGFVSMISVKLFTRADETNILAKILKGAYSYFTLINK